MAPAATRPRTAVCSASHTVPSDLSRGSGWTTTRPITAIPASASWRATVCIQVAWVRPARTTSSASAPSRRRSVHGVPGPTVPIDSLRARESVGAGVVAGNWAPGTSSTELPAPSAAAIWSPGRSSTTTTDRSMASSSAMSLTSAAAASAQPSSSTETGFGLSRTSRTSVAAVRTRAFSADDLRISLRGPRSGAGICATTLAPRWATRSRRNTGRSRTTAATAARRNPSASPPRARCRRRGPG